jgi:hypothetical protein
MTVPRGMAVDARESWTPPLTSAVGGRGAKVKLQLGGLFATAEVAGPGADDGIRTRDPHLGNEAVGRVLPGAFGLVVEGIYIVAINVTGPTG